MLRPAAAGAEHHVASTNNVRNSNVTHSEVRWYVASIGGGRVTSVLDGGRSTPRILFRVTQSILDQQGLMFAEP
jgi:hypothetical protein